MSEWKEYVLEDVVEKFIDYRGKTPQKTTFGIPLITAKIVKSGRILEPNEFIAEEDYDSWMRRGLPEIDDVVLTTEAPLGEVALIKDKNVALAQRIITLRGDKNYVHNHFLKYYFQSPTGQYELESRASGTTVFGIKAAVLKKIPITLPSLPEQRAISSVLSSLDDKIDVLNCQNKTLETIVESLFRYRFIEEGNNGGQIVNLGEFIKCTTGASYKSEDLNPSKNALVTLKNFARGGSFRMDGFKEYTGKFKVSQIVRQGDLIVSHTDITQEADILGNPALVIDTGKYDRLIITMDLMKVESTKEWLSKEFLYYLFKTSEFKSHCLGCSNGTTVLHMSRTAIPNYEYKMPDKEKIISFTETVKPNLDKIFANFSQIRTLEKLRDTLLPKLMSGEVKVEYEKN